jgi:glycosyltransferase involved in cell wall biosynthesis
MHVLIGSTLFLPQEGGAEKQGRLLAAALAQSGVDVGYVTSRLPGTPAREIMAGVTIYRLPVGPWWPGTRRVIGELLYYLSLRRFLCSVGQQYDLFQSQGAFEITAPVMAKVARQVNRRSVIRYASMDDLGYLSLQNPLGRWIWKDTLLADAHITNSPAVYDRMVSKYGLAEDLCRVIPNAVEIPPAQDKSAARHTLGWEQNWQVVLCVGKFDPLKNQKLLIQAWASVAQRYPEARLVLIGDGKTFDACRAMVDDLGLRDVVLMPGKLPNTEVRRYLGASDIFAYPSLYEGQPNALLEAMAFGLACVASDIPGNRSLVEHNQEALIFDPSRVEALQRALLEVLESPELRAGLGVAALHSAKQKHGLEHVAERYLALYRSLSVGG